MDLPSAILLITLWGHNAMTTTQIPMKDKEICEQERPKLLADIQKQVSQNIFTIFVSCIRTR